MHASIIFPFLTLIIPVLQSYQTGLSFINLTGPLLMICEVELNHPPRKHLTTHEPTPEKNYSEVAQPESSSNFPTPLQPQAYRKHDDKHIGYITPSFWNKLEPTNGQFIFSEKNYNRSLKTHLQHCQLKHAF